MQNCRKSDLSGETASGLHLLVFPLFTMHPYIYIYRYCIYILVTNSHAAKNALRVALIPQRSAARYGHIRRFIIVVDVHVSLQGQLAPLEPLVRLLGLRTSAVVPHIPPQPRAYLKKIKMISLKLKWYYLNRCCAECVISITLFCSFNLVVATVHFGRQQGLLQNGSWQSTPPRGSTHAPARH